MRRALLPVMAALACVACYVPVGVQAGAREAGAPAVIVGLHPDVADALTAELNRRRQQHRLASLRTDPALAQAAADYAQELAARRRLDHYSPTPGRQTHTQRISTAGGQWRRAAENLARTAGPRTEVPGQVLDLWLGSAGHRGNLLDKEHTHTGAGVFRDARGDWWIVQLYTQRPARP